MVGWDVLVVKVPSTRVYVADYGIVRDPLLRYECRDELSDPHVGLLMIHHVVAGTEKNQDIRDLQCRSRPGSGPTCMKLPKNPCEETRSCGYRGSERSSDPCHFPAQTRTRIRRSLVVDVELRPDSAPSCRTRHIARSQTQDPTRGGDAMGPRLHLALVLQGHGCSPVPVVRHTTHTAYIEGVRAVQVRLLADLLDLDLSSSLHRALMLLCAGITTR